MRQGALLLALAGLVGVCVMGWHGAFKPLPVGLSVATEPRATGDVRFLADLTYMDAAGHRRVDQTIFDEIFRIIDDARRLIVLDMFLFNEVQGSRREETRALSGELTSALLGRKLETPEIEILLITDPINTVYGGVPAPHLERLREGGISVVVTDLDPLRDSNWLYSSLWRWFIRPLGGGGPGLFPNPFGGERVSLRTDLRVLNFKANHRKTILADGPEGWTALVTSANPHDASSAHGNVAIRFDGRAVADLFDTERAVVEFSGEEDPAAIGSLPPTSLSSAVVEKEGRVAVRILTEGKIGEALDGMMEGAREGDELAVAVFYLSDRGIIEGLVAAHERGVSVRVLLDPNKDAFGLEKNGIPNRPVAHELRRAGIPVRWCDTHGEQCHAKMLLWRRGGEAALVAGSANFTRRNLRDLNLETNVWLSGPVEESVMQDAFSYFDRVWSNEPGRQYSVEYAEYAEDSRLKGWIYRLGEVSGIGTY